ncbi:MAG: peptidylprolyl isomerase [Rudaea sp.]
MSTTNSPSQLSSSDQEQVQKWLAEAEEATKAENWDRAVAAYRRALEFDRALEGVEAKLQWALRMREIETLYRQGKAEMAAGSFEAALISLRKARTKYASHYKDVDELIVQAQSRLQKDKWVNRPGSRAAARKEQRQRQQRVLIAVVVGVVILIAAGAALATSGFGLVAARSTGSVTTSSAGAAAAIPPEERNNMYKSAPAMQIDVNKQYRGIIDTNKGKITVDLFPKDAPQHVNNFVFLAREGFYDNLTFHRVVPGFVIQGGDPSGNGSVGRVTPYLPRSVGSTPRVLSRWRAAAARPRRRRAAEASSI